MLCGMAITCAGETNHDFRQVVHELAVVQIAFFDQMLLEHTAEKVISTANFEQGTKGHILVGAL